MVTRFLNGLEITMEVVDVLVKGRTIEESVERFRKFLLGFCMFNIKLQCGSFSVAPLLTLQECVWVGSKDKKLPPEPDIIGPSHH